MTIGDGIAIFGICLAVIFGIWVTKSANCLWALIFISALM